MRYEEQDRFFHIFVEDDENERSVLRAIVIASFNTAFVDELMKHFKEPMTDSVADFFVSTNHEPDSAVVFLEQVLGRQCETIIKRVAPKHFILVPDYQKKRGSPEPMLKIAKDILEVEKQIG